MVAKRTPKRVAYHDVYRTANPHGEWSIRVEPGGLQIDTFHHKGKRAHLHPPGDYDRPIDLPKLTAEAAGDAILAHLRRRGEIRLEELIVELKEQ